MKSIQDAMLFVKVVQAGSLTKAAILLNSSKSQLSRRLSQLEHQLKVQLLLRQKCGLILTEAGNEFYISCVKIDSDFQAATEKLQYRSANISGTLSITAPLNLGALALGPLITRFMHQWPEIKVELDLTDNYRCIIKEPIDVAIRIANHLSEPGLIETKIFSYHTIICASRQYIEQHGTPTTPWDLTQHKIISTRTNIIGQKIDCWPFIELGQHIDVPVSPAIKAPNHMLQKQLAINGGGIIRIPEYSLAQEITQGTLVPLLDTYNTIETHVFAVHKQLDPVPNRIKLFTAFLQKHLTMPKSVLNTKH